MASSDRNPLSAEADNSESVAASVAEKSRATTSEFDAKGFLKQVTRQSGVYQMYGSEGNILYVGKAKNLKSRLASYFQSSGLAPKTRALVARIRHVEVTITPTEMEALLLEQNLIKQQRPPYNILLRDDKSYPYIMFTSGDAFPRLAMHRGLKRKGISYFGPFPNVGAVKSSLSFLQKTFRLRQCEDSVFHNRTRPCLQHQINRCTAPCVGLINEKEYRDDIRHAEMFLLGKSDVLVKELADLMEAASAELDFEKAAEYRDQISALKRIQAQQIVESGSADVDVIALHQEGGLACVHVLYIRQGRIMGSKSHFPKGQLIGEESEILQAFLGQFYLQSVERDFPKVVLLSHTAEDLDVLSEAIQAQTGRQIVFQSNYRGQRLQWMQLAASAAKENLQAQIASKQNTLQRFEALQDVLGLESMPERLECFDISHSHGELTVASCVVFDINGPLKSDYRRFNIEGITGGDDYAAMEQALRRRYTRLQKGEGALPDILLIDGGKGQLRRAEEVLSDLAVTGVLMIGVAKGTTRKAGFETLILPDNAGEMTLASDSAALHLIQHIRDESHRFAITGHKQRRDKKRRTSRLEDIPGIGAKRRRELLRHFGGLQEVKKASVGDLAKVPLISKKMAEDIYSALNTE
ncbi:excinuclease ABC subunit UvrC [Aestuariicella hydrocarbonica]|uniref:UvrABC system protein C n=1 Tax=Pseudomaricurvus hydrocarbonicus TaxID=1470433 RepID=A0A9E5MJJ5_9GAMM|nr:excinuclease ABC subunit UvrC [Aestuariicella hydrocarbonica]NHO65229.1 excinuclease ABC subunit UvrC [Aestuariicella hydrocarbonica]